MEQNEKNKGVPWYEGMDEIIFQSRNKEYGAYFIRKKYKKYLFVSFLIAFFMLTTMVGIPFAKAYINRNLANRALEKNVTAEMEKVNADEPPPPPPPPPPPAAAEAQVKFKAPVILDTIIEDLTIATTDDLIDQTQNEAPPEEITVDQKDDKVVDAPEEVFYIVEENASFQGGDINTFREWIGKNLKYPEVAQENGIQGRVFVQFAINSHGKVVDVKVVRGVNPDLDKEAIRVIESSPDWSPGKQGGRAVKQMFTIPIVFMLQ